MNNNTKTPCKRGRALTVGVLIAFVAVGVGVFGAPAVLAVIDEQKHSPDNEGPITEKRVVAAGVTERFGRWEIVSSQDGNSEPCLGVRLLDAENARQDDPTFGLPTLVEGCGQAVDDQVGTLGAPQGKSGTLLFGRIRDDAARVTISSGNSVLTSATARRGKDGRKYVLTEVTESVGEAQIVSIDERGRSLGRVDPGAR